MFLGTRKVVLGLALMSMWM